MNFPTTSIEKRMQEGQALVHALAQKVHGQMAGSTEREDLIAYGELGLAEAARDFNPERGAKFTTFAYYRVRGAIYDGLSKMSWNSRSRYRRIRTEQLASQALAEEDSNGQNQTLTNTASWLQGMTNRLATVYLASHGEDGQGIRDSTLEDPTAPQAPAIVAYREIREKLRNLVKGLPDTERQLIQMTYFEGITLTDAAASLAISKSWASRMHARILDQLAKSLRDAGLAD